MLLEPAPATGVMDFQSSCQALLPAHKPSPKRQPTLVGPLTVSCLAQEEARVWPTLENLWLPFTDSPVLPIHRYAWEKDGATLAVETNPRIRLDKNGSLHISQTWSGDIGTYTCRVLSAGGNDSRNAHLRVR